MAGPKKHEVTQDFPSDVPIIGATLRRVNAVGFSQGPFSLREDVMVWPGQRWEVELEFLPQVRADAAVLEAFLTSLRGSAGMFRIGDPWQSLPRGANNGTPFLKGAAVAGSQTIETDGWAVSIAGQLLANDLIQIRSDLYVVLEDVNSDAAGVATIHLWPDLRAAYSDNTVVITENARGVFRLQRSPAFSRDRLGYFGTRLEAVEALGRPLEFYLVEQVDLGIGAYSIYGDPYALIYAGKLYCAPIESDGTKDVMARQLDIAAGTVTSKKIVTSDQDDDHNMGGPMIDPAAGELMFAQTDHASGSLAGFRFSRGTSLDVADLPASPTVFGSGACTYAGGYLRPTALETGCIVMREGPGIEGNWRVERSVNLNGAPPVFSTEPIAVGQYLKSRVARDGSGFWLAFQGQPEAVDNVHDHPQQPARITLWKIRWSDNAILTGKGVVAVADFTAMGAPLRFSNVNRVADSDWFESGSAWTRTNATVTTLSTSGNRTGYTGANTHSKLYDTGASNTYHRMSQNVSVTAGERIEISCFLRIGVGEKDSALLYGVQGSLAAGDPYVGVRIVNGVPVIDVSFGLSFTALETDWANGWIRIGGSYVADTTVTGGIFLFQREDTGSNGPLHTTYPAHGTGLHVQGMQVAKTPYLDRLLPYMQNIGAPAPAAQPPEVIHDCEGTEHAIILDFLENETHVNFLIASYGRWDGAKFGEVPERRGDVLFKSYNKTTGAIDEAFEVSDLGDGYDDDPTTGTFTYHGGTFVGTTGREFVVDESNLYGNAKTRLVHFRSIAAGAAWSKSILLETDGGNDDVLRPHGVDEVKFENSVYTVERSRRIIYMRGQYAGYIPSRGGFNTSVWAAKVAPEV